MDHADTTVMIDWRRLLHRWLVEYNPFYLVSATLCLAGMRLTSRGLAVQGSAFGEIGVAAITELYALALIGGAALLTRIGQRRPGVMLALLAAVYQGDVALHTEASTYLGHAGVASATAWAALFVAKLYALAWAVKLRPSRAAMGLAAYGGVGLAVIPHLLGRMNEHSGSALATLWVFSVVSIGLNVSRGVESAVELDAWGRTVLRRSTRAVWLLWSAILALHVVFWSMTLWVSLSALAPAAVLLATRFVRRETRVWATVAATLVVAALVAPELFSQCALMAALTLALRAYRHHQLVTTTATASAAAPFRATEGEPAAPVTIRTWVLAPAAPAARRRLLVGALFASYLAVWTVGWSGGPWPLHALPLDAALTAVVLVLATRMRVRIALPPLAISYAHMLVQVHVVTAPRSTLQWGVLTTGVAFALLIASLAASYSLRGVTATRGEGSLDPPPAPRTT